LAHYYLGRAQQARGELNEAAAEYTLTIRMAPQFADAYYSMGILQRDAGRTPQAVSLFQAAVRANPGMLNAHLCLANLHIVMGRPDEAVAASRAAIELDPDSASAQAHLAAGCQIQGDLAGAIAAFRRAIELAPDDVTSHSSLIYSVNFDPAYSAEEIFAEHLEWASRFSEPLTAQAAPHDNDRSPDRRLRIGYVSAHFREHAVSFFSLPMLAAHDHKGFEIFCYSNAHEGEADAITAQFKKSADAWRDVAEDSDEALAKLIREDKIDVLVDLTGHIRGSRLTALARKPAPVQVTYLGYQNTTGMSAMDYRLSDAHANPRGMSDAYYTERLVLLPRSFFCYRPPDGAPEVSELPALAAGHVTFGWFNYIAKTTPEAIESWAQILAAVPGARLLVLGYRGGVFEDRIREVIKAAGVDPLRVEVLDHCRPDEYLQLHHRIDIALDAFPFNGHTTVCNALWMGVPSIVRQGTSYASRFGGTALVNLGLEDLIAKSGDEYIEIAARLAGDLDRLAELRRTLRSRMAASPLMDSAGFARIVEKAYRTMWRKWCRVD
jgi:predicted O-linked N-acetylglucosamine transferase (SPINDLY family)